MTSTISTLLKVYNTNLQSIKYFHCSSLLNDWRWRCHRSIEPNPVNHPALLNSPDYSFKDGRPVPYGVGQKRRIDKQRDMYKQITQYSQHLDNTIERHKMMQQSIIDKRQNILDRKLQKKGKKFLTNSNQNETVVQS